jgi:hypothetical protein
VASSADLVLLLPCLDDWEALGLLLPRIDAALAKQGARARVLLVDDASTRPAPEELAHARLDAVAEVDVLRLRRNLGHQRAIAVGLAWIDAHLPCRAVAVMDADGEDAPEDLPHLLERFEESGGRRVVFAARTRRTESALFRLLYLLYRAVHRLTTGIAVRAGNFSVLPAALLHRLVVVSDLWNHYAAAVYKAGLPFELVPTQRGRRLAGRSRMSAVALVIHGLSAISVFGDRFGVRLLAAAGALILLATAALATALFASLSTGAPIPGAVALGAGLLLVILIQTFVAALVLTFVILAARDGSGTIPARDYALFVDEVRRLRDPGG